MSPSRSFPVDVGTPMTTDEFSLPPGSTNQLELRMRIQTGSLGVDDEGEPVPQYNYRVNYTVLDEQGIEIDSGSGQVVWNSAVRRWENSSINEQQGRGSLVVLSSLDTFEAPTSGTTRVQLEIEPDGVYHSQADGVELRVYEDVSDTKQQTLFSGALCCSTPVFVLLGLALILYGPILLTTRAKRKTRV